MHEPKSVVKVVQYNNLTELLQDCYKNLPPKDKTWPRLLQYFCAFWGTSHLRQKRPTVASPTAGNKLF